MTGRSEASRKGWVSRKRQAAARAARPTAALEAKMAGARETMGSAPVNTSIRDLMARIRAHANGETSR